MNRFRTSHSENQKKYRRLKRYWKLLLKDSTTLEPLKRHYHRLFKRPISQTEIVDELLSYNEELRTAYHFCQLLRYYFVKRVRKAFKKPLKQFHLRYLSRLKRNSRSSIATNRVFQMPLRCPTQTASLRG